MSAEIIKAVPSSGLPSLTAGIRIVKRQVYVADQEARCLVEKASGVARALIADAADQSTSIFENARKQGYQDGLSQWNEIITEAIRAKDEYLAASENDLLRLAVKIAEKIIGEQLRLQPETIALIVREGLKSAPREHRLVIQVSPSDADAVNRHLRKLLESATFPPPQIEVSPTESVAPGGCVIVSQLGRVDARLETQLQTMERVLLKSER